IILSLGQLLSFLIKLALEKQELEWEKVQLTGILPYCALVFIAVFDTHNNNITFQGKYQVSAELKDKEINNLKEELKSLQLLKYNLEKKSSELVRRDPPFIQSVDR
uniref:Uncharacterized protein n=1 Tax=Xiphophorus maculatus TaxID=8083 RepID=A0A3B5RCJ9_XIPMA